MNISYKKHKSINICQKKLIQKCNFLKVHMNTEFFFFVVVGNTDALKVLSQYFIKF